MLGCSVVLDCGASSEAGRAGTLILYRITANLFEVGGSCDDRYSLELRLQDLDLLSAGPGRLVMLTRASVTVTSAL